MPHIAHRDFEMSPYNSQTISVFDAARGIVNKGDDARKKVAIIGAGVGRDHAPYDDPEWEVWGLNAIAPCDRFGRLRVDRWFEMHIMSVQSEDDMQWIARCPVPIYLVPSASSWRTEGPHPLHNPQQVRYPLEKVEGQFRSYFTCSFAYMIALALFEGFEDIGVYGGELCYGTERERTVEWACVSWWVGFAQGRGANIHLPPGSHIGTHCYRYGIEYHQEKRDVEHYIDQLRQSDKLRNVDTTIPYDSSKEFSQGG